MASPQPPTSKKEGVLAMTHASTKSRRTPSKLCKLDPTCAGIDIGSAELFVCIAKNASEQEVRCFPTFTADLRSMIEWLRANGVKSVAMESTSVYWIPPFEMLEEAGFEVLLVNAGHLKHVPSHKTDVKDCRWIQQLHSYGLLRGSFRPVNEVVELRAYVRQRSRLFQSAAVQVQLMHKALTQMNIQLANVISDVTGKTGLTIIQKIIEGERDPNRLALNCFGRCKEKRPLIAKSLEGNYRNEHLFSLTQAYEAYEFFHRQVEVCEERIQASLSRLPKNPQTMNAVDKVEDSKATDNTKVGQTSTTGSRKRSYNRSPYAFNASHEIKKVTVADLTTIPGIDANTAMIILSEIGSDMSKWPDSKAFASWLGLCPGNKVSGGKILSGKTKVCANRAALALRMAASSLYRAKTALGAFFRRVRSRLGAPKAITATAHKLARIIYRMMTEGVDYLELGENYYEQQYRERVEESLRRRAKELGFNLIRVEEPAIA